MKAPSTGSGSAPFPASGGFGPRPFQRAANAPFEGAFSGPSPGPPAASSGGGTPSRGPFRDHFSGRAAHYRAHRPEYPPDLVDFLREVAPRRSLAWDAGCGSGQLSVGLARHFDRVVGSDASRAQLARAPRHPRVWYRCARSEASGLPDAVVDLTTVAQAAHWFDLALFYEEVRRVGRAGSAIALVSYGTPETDLAVGDVIRDLYSNVLGPHWPRERCHVEQRYRSLPFPFDEIETPEFEVRLRWRLSRLIGYIETWSAVRALEASEGPAPLARFRRALTEAWGPERSTREIRWPIALRAGFL